MTSTRSRTNGTRCATPPFTSHPDILSAQCPHPSIYPIWPYPTQLFAFYLSALILSAQWPHPSIYPGPYGLILLSYLFLITFLPSSYLPSGLILVSSLYGLILFSYLPLTHLPLPICYTLPTCTLCPFTNT